MKHARTDYDRIQDPSGKIPDDEPVFLIRGQDVAGPGTVLDWARRAASIGADPKIVALARQQAEKMVEWQAKHGRKIPDHPDK